MTQYNIRLLIKPTDRSARHLTCIQYADYSMWGGIVQHYAIYELEDNGVVLRLTAETVDFFFFTTRPRTNLGPKKTTTHLIPWDPSPRTKLSHVMLKTNLHITRWESVEFYLHSSFHALDAELKDIDNIYNFDFEVLTVFSMKFQSSGIWRHTRWSVRTVPSILKIVEEEWDFNSLRATLGMKVASSYEFE